MFHLRSTEWFGDIQNLDQTTKPDSPIFFVFLQTNLIFDIQFSADIQEFQKIAKMHIQNKLLHLMPKVMECTVHDQLCVIKTVVELHF